MAVHNIPKTMIFIDKINNSILIAEHLLLLFPQHMSYVVKKIICPFYFNLQASTRKDFIENFRLKNTHILVCIEAAGMRVNIWNVAHAI